MSLTDFFELLSLLANQNFIAKVVFVVLISLYGFFAVILARQIALLSNVVNQKLTGGLLKMLSIIHIAASFLLLVVVLFAL